VKRLRNSEKNKTMLRNLIQQISNKYDRNQNQNGIKQRKMTTLLTEAGSSLQDNTATQK